MTNIDYEILGKKVLEKYPYIAKELIETPTLNNLELLPEILQTIQEEKGTPISKKQHTDFRMIVTAVIVKLYDPEIFSGYKRNLRHGLRQSLSNQMNCSPTQISHLLKSVRDYLSIYSDFAQEVIYLYEKIRKEYAEEERK